jgi:hypothetical protein
MIESFGNNLKEVSTVERKDGMDVIETEGKEAVLRYYALKSMPEGEELPELPSAYLLEDGYHAGALTVRKKINNETGHEFTAISITNDEGPDKPLVYVYIQWPNDPAFLNLISEGFRPGFFRTSLFVNKMKIAVNDKIAKRLHDISYDPQKISQDEGAISSAEAVKKILGR